MEVGVEDNRALGEHWLRLRNGLARGWCREGTSQVRPTNGEGGKIQYIVYNTTQYMQTNMANMFFYVLSFLALFYSVSLCFPLFRKRTVIQAKVFCNFP